MRKSLKVVAFGGDPADAFLKAAGITDATITSAVKTLVRGLQADGLWSKMLGIYPLVGGTASSHAWNLKDTTKLKITWVGGMTHDSTGVTGNGTNSYGQPGAINATNTPPLTATNYGISSYQRNTSAEYIAQIGFGYSNGYVHHSYGGGTLNYFRGITASPDTVGNANKIGLIQMYGGSGIGSGFINGTKVISGTGGTLPPPAQDTYLWFAGTNGNGYSNRNFAFFTVSQYLTDTEASNLYTRIQTFQTSLNRYVGVPIYPSFDSDAQSFMTSASITDSTQQAAVNALVTDLKSANLWTKMKAVYPFVGGTASSHSYKLKDPAQFQITFNGGWTHSSTGALPNGTNAYAETLNPNVWLTTPSHLSKYTSTNANKGTDEIDMGVTNFWLSAWYNGSGYNSILARNQSSSVLLNGGTVTDSRGFVLTTKIGTTAKIFKNNVQKDSQTDTTTTYTNTGIYLGAGNFSGPNYYSVRNFSFASIGDGLTDTDASNLYTIVQNYQTILNRQV